MKNNIIEKNKKETNELLIRNLGITIEEFQTLSTEEKKIILKKYNKVLKYKTNSIKDLKKSNSNNIIEKYKEETNSSIINSCGITLEELERLSIEELIILFRNKNNDISHNDSKIKIKKRK